MQIPGHYLFNCDSVYLEDTQESIFSISTTDGFVSVVHGVDLEMVLVLPKMDSLLWKVTFTKDKAKVKKKINYSISHSGFIYVAFEIKHFFTLEQDLEESSKNYKQNWTHSWTVMPLTVPLGLSS